MLSRLRPPRVAEVHRRGSTKGNSRFLRSVNDFPKVRRELFLPRRVNRVKSQHRFFTPMLPAQRSGRSNGESNDRGSTKNENVERLSRGGDFAVDLARLRADEQETAWNAGLSKQSMNAADNKLV